MKAKVGSKAVGVKVRQVEEVEIEADFFEGV